MTRASMPSLSTGCLSRLLLSYRAGQNQTVFLLICTASEQEPLFHIGEGGTVLLSTLHCEYTQSLQSCTQSLQRTISQKPLSYPNKAACLQGGESPSLYFEYNHPEIWDLYYKTGSLWVIQDLSLLGLFIFNIQGQRPCNSSTQ